MKRKGMTKSFEVVVVGGGITGAALGYGLAKSGSRVAVVDATPTVDRASRSNMGLIWCQSKAMGNPEYVRWGFTSSRLFEPLAIELAETTGIDIAYHASGGIIPCLGEEEFNKRSYDLEVLRKEAGGKYPGTMVERSVLEKLLPKIQFGEKVVGGTWCPEDGFVEPLKLLFALRKGLTRMGGNLIPDCRVTHIAPDKGEYRLKTTKRDLICEKIVLAGGLGNRQLAAHFRQKVPVTPDRGQILLTERVADILPIPILGISRTPGGTILVGFMHENMGTDLGFVPQSIAKEARWAASVWPALRDLRVIRCWSSLRVMPLDGYPIYSKIPGHNHAFIINAHSAVTLAAVHVQELPKFILGNPLPNDAAGFAISRFQQRS
jgi:glycine/D-amino acid oxidase-like deaminating enzyme